MKDATLMPDTCHDCGTPLAVLLVCLGCGGKRYKRDGDAWLRNLTEEMGIIWQQKPTKKKRTSWDD